MLFLYQKSEDFSLRPKRLVFDKLDEFNEKESTPEEEIQAGEAELEKKQEEIAKGAIDEKTPEDEAQASTEESEKKGEKEEKEEEEQKEAETTFETPDAKQINQELLANAGKFHDRVPEKIENYEDLNKKLAELSGYSEMDIRAGHAIAPGNEEDKYALYAELFLKKEVDPETGQQCYRVQNLNTDFLYRVIGAATCTPPCFQIATICTNGVYRTGYRDFKHVEGYFDLETDQYIKIQNDSLIYPGGRKIVEGQTRFISEDSEEYKKLVDEEKTNFANVKSRAASYSQNLSAGRLDSELGAYSGPSIYNLSELNQATKENLAEGGAAPEQIEKIMTAKRRGRIVRAYYDHYGIKEPLENEVDGGSQLVLKGAELVKAFGWNDNLDSKQLELLADLENQANQLEAGEHTITLEGNVKMNIIKDEEGNILYKSPTGLEITDLFYWSAKQIIRQNPKQSKTVEFIRSINGYQKLYIDGKGFEFQLTDFYSPTYSDVVKIYNMLEFNSEEYIKALIELQKQYPESRIPNKLAIEAFENLTKSGADQRIPLDRGAFGNLFQTNPRLQGMDWEYYYDGAFEKGTVYNQVRLNFDKYICGNEYGENQCANFVSQCMGWPKTGRVQTLTRDVIASLYAKNNYLDVVTDYDQMKEGDLYFCCSRRKKGGVDSSKHTHNTLATKIVYKGIPIVLTVDEGWTPGPKGGAKCVARAANNQTSKETIEAIFDEPANWDQMLAENSGAPAYDILKWVQAGSNRMIIKEKQKDNEISNNGSFVLAYNISSLMA